VLLQAKYAHQFEIDDAQFEVVCGGRCPSFVVSVAKKRPTAQPETDSDAENTDSASSVECDEDRAIREAKEANRRRKYEQRAQENRERKLQKEAGVCLVCSDQPDGLVYENVTDWWIPTLINLVN